MKARPIRLIVGVLAVLLCMPAAVLGQGTFSPTAAAQPASVLSEQQLDQLLAPIALYPDQLLGQILMAATYPLEVVEAARWLQTPGNAALKGDALANALAAQDWDPSVKSLVPFPRIIQMMSDNLSWMEKLGDAFLAQQADVMDSVQRLRREAQASGKLQSNSQQAVTTDGQTIIIQPANPQVIYVPVYNPTVVYSPWPYSGYPPYYFPWPGYAPESVLLAGIFFGIGIAIVTEFWDWDYCDWHYRRIHIDDDRYNRINRYEIEHFNRAPIQRDTWEHDPYHRRGVAYRDPVNRERFTKAMVGSPDARRAYRGYGEVPSVQGAAPRPPRAAERPAAVQQPRAVQPPPTVEQPPTVRQPRAERRAPTVEQPPAVRQPRAVQRAPTVEQPPTVQQPVTVPQPRAVQRAPVVQQATVPSSAPPVFGGIGSGHDIRAQSERGRASRQTAAPTIAPRVAPSRSAPTVHTPSGTGTMQRAPSTGQGPSRPPSGDRRGVH